MLHVRMENTRTHMQTWHTHSRRHERTQASARTHTHTPSELISQQYGAAFEGSREPVVDEPLNNSLGQA